jgi:hypothetical protein
MSDESVERSLTFFFYSLSALAITGSASALFIIVHNWHNLPTALSTTAEIMTGSVLVGGGGIVVGKSAQAVIKVIHDVQIQYTIQYKAVKEHVPSLFAGAILIAETWMIVVDKSFHGDEVKTVVVSVVTFLLFMIAKHLGSKGKWRKIASWLIWSAGILLLPVAICVNESWTVADLFHHVRNLAIEAQIVIALSLPALLVVPFAFEP